MYHTHFQSGLTAVHIACRMGRKSILNDLIAKAKTQKHFNFKRNLPSDYEVAMSAKQREVCDIHNMTESWGILLYNIKL